MKAELARLGITLDLSTGFISYMPDFVPEPLRCGIIYVRHGETYCNRMGCFQGVLEEITDDGFGLNDLTEKGIEQAQKAAVAILSMKLSPEFPSAILVSPLRRARKTGEIICSRLAYDREHIVLDDLSEINFGLWENQRLSTLQEAHKILAKNYLSGDALAKTEEGESFAQLILRANRVLSYINDNWCNTQVLVIAHGALGNAMRLLRQQLTVAPEGHIKWHAPENELPNAFPIVIS